MQKADDEHEIERRTRGREEEFRASRRLFCPSNSESQNANAELREQERSCQQTPVFFILHSHSSFLVFRGYRGPGAETAPRRPAGTPARHAIDLIVSNPPYIPAADMETLQTEVRDHEPRIALTPGPRGTEVIEKLLATGIPAIIEIGYGQLGSLHVDEAIPDLAGIPRVVVSSARHGGK